MYYTHIFWDWNGTLIDDMECSLSAVNRMLTERGRQKITRAQYYKFIDTPIINFYKHIFDFTEITIEEIMRDFNRYYDMFIGSNPLMCGAAEVLSFFNALDISQIVLSASSNKIIHPFAERLGIKGFFKHILGSADGYVNSKTERAVSFIKDNGIEPAFCVLIGDTLHDFETAKTIGCDCVLFTKGHQSKEDLLKTGAVLADDIMTIPDLLKNRVFGLTNV